MQRIEHALRYASLLCCALVTCSSSNLPAQQPSRKLAPANQRVYAEVYSSGDVDPGFDETIFEPEIQPGNHEQPACDERLQNWLNDRFENNWFHRHCASLTGWWESGMTTNGDKPSNGSNRPVGFNDRANDFLVNQLYLSVSREAEYDPYDHGFGFQVDLFWGSDARFTKAPGFDSGWLDSHAIYQLSMPQMFVEFYLPYDGGIDVKLGRFYGILGYESVTAPHNFFYSHSYAFLYGEPFTHTGLLADWNIDDRFSASLGLHNGWNDFSDPDSNPFGVLGGFTFKNDAGNFSLAYAFSWSQEAQDLYVVTTSGRVPFTTEGDRFVQSLVAAARVTDRLTYVFQTDFGLQSKGAAILDPATLLPDSLQTAEWYGISQYLMYRFNDCLTGGVRYEWFHDDDGTRVPSGQEQGLTGINVTSGAIQGITGVGSNIHKGDFHAVTLGLNWKPKPCLTIRPELRIDISRLRRKLAPGIGGVFDDLSDNNQVTLATDVVYRF